LELRGRLIHYRRNGHTPAPAVGKFGDRFHVAVISARSAARDVARNRRLSRLGCREQK
jgi:hypothetical protein